MLRQTRQVSAFLVTRPDPLLKSIESEIGTQGLKYPPPDNPPEYKSTTKATYTNPAHAATYATSATQRMSGAVAEKSRRSASSGHGVPGVARVVRVDREFGTSARPSAPLDCAARYMPLRPRARVRFPHLAHAADTLDLCSRSRRSSITASARSLTEGLLFFRA